ncbi:hypothetical protein SB11R_18870 [Pseudomonas oryzihabitans]|nr:hypothetical protein SB11R_18870 [Pseudomonas psychrotolerans]
MAATGRRDLVEDMDTWIYMISLQVLRMMFLLKRCDLEEVFFIVIDILRPILPSYTGRMLDIGT